MESRQALLWHATKARKKNLIDGKTLDVVRRLVKEPSTPTNDLKLETFLSSFLAQLAKKDASFAVHSTDAESAHEDTIKKSTLEQLPQDLVSVQICKFLTNEDLICIAQTSFGVNTLFLPPNGWGRLITAKLESNKFAPVLQELFPLNGQQQPTRYEAMQNFSKGVGFLQIGNEDKDRIAFEVMQRYLLPRIFALHFKLTCALQNKSAGETMFLERAECEFPHIKLAFKVAGSPPVVNVGNPQSQFTLHALGHDGHSISPIAKFTCGQRNASSSTVQLASTQDDGCGGKAGITLCGERSARWLGRLMYNDEYHFQVDLTTTANGQHGMGNHLSSGFRESIVLQTPRTVFKVPDRYYEVAPALGIVIMVPMQMVFEHYVNLMMLECCVESIESAQAGVDGGCDRLEICSNLSEGGVTPSFGLFKQIRTMFPQIFIACLIRARPGDFVYSKEELVMMCIDIELFTQSGANGIVIGALRRNCTVDIEAMHRLVRCANNVEVTFHRAIDLCPRPVEVIELCKNIGVNRILSSGGANTALEGVNVLKKMVVAANGTITICAAGGITEDNCVEIITLSQVHQVHGSLRIVRPLSNVGINLGSAPQTNLVTCAQRVRNVKCKI